MPVSDTWGLGAVDVMGESCSSHSTSMGAFFKRLWPIKQPIAFKPKQMPEGFEGVNS
ncbi:hypothetical protein [Dyella flagellata]|uniref:hypothetical protein n=1 Tax=Dyella flagellata TaxID=1867833 RepID=UPI0024E171DB|nr:hypothetical protein [Dyella flagellata]